MTQIKFGTDGWRAVMDTEYTTENVERVAQAFADYINENHSSSDSRSRIVIGFDFRNHSEDYAATFARVLIANGLDITLSNKAVPTPAVSRAVIDQSFDAGIAITASHNPGNYNGVKIKDAQGSSADRSVTGRVEELIDKNPVKKDQAVDLSSLKKDILKNYLAGVRKYIHPELFKKSVFHVLVDSMHGVGAHHIQDILKNSSIEVTTIRGERDIQFGGVSPEPILKNMNAAAELMKQGKFDVALVTDGDADRIGALRPGGDFVSPGTLLSLLMLHLAQDLGKKGSVVTTVSNTSLIDRVAKKLGLAVRETPVGFKYICEIMRKENVLIAGEESGGLAFQNYMLERDGILTGLLIIQMMAYRNQKFETILKNVEKEFGKFYYIRNDIKIPEKSKLKVLKLLQETQIQSIAGSRVLERKTLDGVKFTFENDAWLLFRMSGTEPLLRIYAESTDSAQAKAFVDWGQSHAFSVK